MQSEFRWTQIWTITKAEAKSVLHVLVFGAVVVMVTHIFANSLNIPYAATGSLMYFSYAWVGPIRRCVRSGLGMDGLSFIGAVIFATMTISFALIYMKTGLIDPDHANEPTSIYTAWYFSVVTFTTLGYGDVRPTSDSRFCAALEAVSGLLILSICVATAIGEYQSHRARLQQPEEK